MADVVDLDDEIRLEPALLRTNCWTCAFGGSEGECGNPDFAPDMSEQGWSIQEWIDATHPPVLCPRTASGCPGWSPK